MRLGPGLARTVFQSHHVSVDVLQFEDLVGPIVPQSLRPVMRLKSFDDLPVQLDQRLLRRRVGAEVDGLDGAAPPATDALHHLQRDLA